MINVEMGIIVHLLPGLAGGLLGLMLYLLLTLRFIRPTEPPSSLAQSISDPEEQAD
ncbi:MAG: hypothetical protein AAGG51_11075 [Cyanobacteria bacterium P01_G01_bin.54]